MRSIPTVRRASAFQAVHPDLARLNGAWIGQALIALGFCVLVVLIQRFDAPGVLLGIVALLAASTLLLRPELATLLTVFLLYMNIPAILTKRHGVPIMLAGAFILLLGIPLLDALIARRATLRIDRTFWLMLGYLAVVIVSAAYAKDSEIALEAALRFVLDGLLVYFLIVNVIRSGATLRRVIWTMLLAGGVLGGLTAYQQVTGSFRQEFGGLAERNYDFVALEQESSDDPEARELMQAYVQSHPKARPNTRANGPVDEPNRFAQILIVLLPLALYGYRAARNTWSRLAAAGTGALICSAILLSGSRGAFLTIVVLAGLAGYNRWIPRRQLMVGASVLVLLLPLLAPKYLERIASVVGVRALVGREESPSVDGAMKARAAAMLAAARVTIDHPVLGVGAGQFQPFYSREYQLKDVGSRIRYVKPWYAHSLYLELSAELGIVGLAVFLAIFVDLLRRLARARRDTEATLPEFAGLATALSFSVLAYLGASVFLHLAFQRYLWLLVAVCGAALHLRESPDGEGLQGALTADGRDGGRQDSVHARVRLP